MSEQLCVLAVTIVGLVLSAMLATRGVRAGFPLPDRSHRFTSIDGLRGYLALSVVASHFMIWFHTLDGSAPAPLGLNRVEANLGKAAVVIFFMITAFLFYPRTLGGIRAMSLRYLLVSRLFRLYPLFAAAVAASALLLWSLAGPAAAEVIVPSLGALAQWLSFTGLPDLFGVANSGLLTLHQSWSLGWEWLFYLALLPITALLMSLRPVAVPTWIVPVGFVLLAVALRLMAAASAQLHAASNYLAHFAAGMLVWEICARPRLRRICADDRFALGGLAALLTGIVFFPYPGIVTLVFYVPIFAVAAAGNSLFGVLTRPSSLALGEVSYGIYLLHQLVITLLLDAGHVRSWASPAVMLGLLPVTMLLVTMLAAATFLTIEKPMIARGHAVGRRYRTDAARRTDAQPAVQPS